DYSDQPGHENGYCLLSSRVLAPTTRAVLAPLLPGPLHSVASAGGLRRVCLLLVFPHALLVTHRPGGLQWTDRRGIFCDAADCRKRALALPALLPPHLAPGNLSGRENAQRTRCAGSGPDGAHAPVGGSHHRPAGAGYSGYLLLVYTHRQ